jgi:formylglycine-generating enzyme required for sulfatase activity
MGSPADEPLRHKSEGPQTTVQIAPFALGETEVTRAQYAQFVQETKREHTEGCVTDPDGDGEVGVDGGVDGKASWRDPGYSQGDDHPAVCISWQDASDYAAWLSRKTGKRYRLPSESEWEYAARGGTTTTFFWGAVAEDGCRYANAADQAYRRGMPNDKNLKVECEDGVVLTAPVGHYPPNPFGLLDITGNVWEVVEDCWTPTLDGIPTDGSARETAGCDQRVDRGGSFNDYPEDFRIASRHHVGATDRWGNDGFRVARELAAGELPH